MDSSLMSLFFPDKMHRIMMPFLQKNGNAELRHIKSAVLDVATQIRTPGTVGHLHDLRNQLLRFNETEDQRNAFQPENKFGFVFYFLQEFLRLFEFPPLVAQRAGKVRTASSLPHSHKKHLELYVVEVEYCRNETLQKCLEKNYRGWAFERDSLRYLIIELISHDVSSQLTMRWQGVRWTLQSMIVFDCSHFVAYMRKDGAWYMHDDNRTFQQVPITEYEFGDYYQRGMCHFEYGVKNTFFFYAPE